jgi:hypothetical protein
MYLTFLLTYAVGTSFLLDQKGSKKDTTSKNSQILLSHSSNPLIAVQNLEFT